MATKHILPLILMLGAAGCDADDGVGKSIHDLEAEVAIKQAQLERAKQSGGILPILTPKMVCIRGVAYYTSRSYGGFDHYSVAYNVETLQPERCRELIK